MPFGKIGGMGCNLVGYNTFANVISVGQTQVLFRRDIAKHRTSVPANLRCSDAGGEVIVSRSDIGREWPQRIKGRFVAPLNLLLHVFLNQMHGHMTGPLIHHLATFGPSSFGQLPLNFQFRQLCVVVRVGNRTRSQSVTDRETHIVSGADVANLVPMLVEKVFFLVVNTPLCQDRTTT